MCKRFLRGYHIDTLCRYWGVPPSRWHGTCSVDMLPRCFMNRICMESSDSIGVSGDEQTCENVVHGFGVNTSYSFQRGSHWIGVFVQFEKNNVS